MRRNLNGADETYRGEERLRDERPDREVPPLGRNGDQNDQGGDKSQNERKHEAHVAVRRTGGVTWHDSGSDDDEYPDGIACHERDCEEGGFYASHASGIGKAVALLYIEPSALG